MRPTTNFALHAVLAAALAALATSSATAAATFSLVGARFKNASGNYSPGRTDRIEVQSFHWGPRQTTSADGSRTRTGNKVMMDDTHGGSAANERQTAEPHKDDAGRELAAVDGQPAPSGLPTGKRQHKPMTIKAELDRTATTTHEPKPPRDSSLGSESERTLVMPHVIERGSLTMQGSFSGCSVGGSYPEAVLQTAAARYELKDVVISGCAADSVSLNYAKVRVRAWNPSKKEE